MNKDGNDVPQYSGHTENTTSRTTSGKGTSQEDYGKVGTLGTIKSKNQQILRQDNFVETDKNNESFKNVTVLSENIGINSREAESRNKTNEEKRSFIFKLTKKSEAGKENWEMSSSSDPVPKEHSPRSQLCSGNKYKTTLDLKHNKISKDGIVVTSPNRLHSQKVLLPQQSTGLVNANKAKLQNSLESASNLPGLLSRAGKDIKENNGTDTKISLEPEDLPKNEKWVKQNVTCIITKKICPFDHQSSHPGPFILTFGQPDLSQKTIELTFECFHTRTTTDGSQTVLAPKPKTTSNIGKQEGSCLTDTETGYSKQIYYFTLEEQCLEESNAVDQNLPWKLSKPITVQEENTSQKVKEVSEKSTPVSTSNSTCSTIPQTEQKREAHSSNRHNEVSPESCIAIYLANAHKNDHCYVKPFCKSENSKKKHHTDKKNPIYKLSEDFSSHLNLPGEEVKIVEDINPTFLLAQGNSSHHGLQVKEERNLTEDRNPLFPSEVNSLNPELQVEEEQNHTEGRNLLFPSTEVNSSHFEFQKKDVQNHNEDWWGFYTLMNIGVLLRKLPVKKAKSIANDNIQLSSTNISEETSTGNDGIGWRNTSHDAWDSWRLLSEVSTSADPPPV